MRGMYLRGDRDVINIYPRRDINVFEMIFL